MAELARHVLTDSKTQAYFMRQQFHKLHKSLVLPSGFYRWSDHTLAQAIELHTKEWQQVSDEFKSITSTCKSELKLRDFQDEQIETMIHAFETRCCFGSIPEDLMPFFHGLSHVLLNGRSSVLHAGCDLQYLMHQAVTTQNWTEINKIREGDFSLVMSIVLQVQLTVRVLRLFIETRVKHYTNEESFSGIKLMRFLDAKKKNIRLRKVGAPRSFIKTTDKVPTVICEVEIGDKNFIVPLSVPIVFFLFGNTQKDALFSLLNI